MKDEALGLRLEPVLLLEQELRLEREYLLVHQVEVMARLLVNLFYDSRLHYLYIDSNIEPYEVQRLDQSMASSTQVNIEDYNKAHNQGQYQYYKSRILHLL